jgi:hypothetical protein
MNRRNLLQLTGVSLGFSATGCLGTDPPQDTKDQSQSGDSNSPEPDQSKDEGSDSSRSDVFGSPTPQPDHKIQMVNMRSDPVNMTVTVHRQKTGKTVHNQTYTLQPSQSLDKTVTAYNTRQANPDGIETFNVSVTANGSSDSFTVETDMCQGDITAQVTESDGINWGWAEC